MSNRRYPEVGRWETRDVSSYPAYRQFRCVRCKQGFKGGERFQVRETQVNWFRGDDEVEFRHIQCPPREQVK